jgi:L-proline 4-hydroxylase
MRWDDRQRQQIDEQGFLFVPRLLQAGEVGELQAAIPALLAGSEEADGMHRERERSGAVRQVYLTHRHCPPFRALARDSRVVGPVQQLLGEVYVWHSKINVKAPFEGTVWLWHQDYGYWMWDGVGPRLLSVMVLLDRATLNNGCLLVAAGSHRWGRLEHYPDEVTTSYKQWCVDRPTLQEQLSEEMIRPITGEPGDALFFHCNLLHASGHNLSPLPRNTIILAYNALDNKPRPVERPRPDWVVARQFDPV